MWKLLWLAGFSTIKFGSYSKVVRNPLINSDSSQSMKHSWSRKGCADKPHLTLDDLMNIFIIRGKLSVGCLYSSLPKVTRFSLFSFGRSALARRFLEFSLGISKLCGPVWSCFCLNSELLTSRTMLYLLMHCLGKLDNFLGLDARLLFLQVLTFRIFRFERDLGLISSKSATTITLGFFWQSDFFLSACFW